MIREFRYVLMDPTGNRTLLVRTPVPVEEQLKVAAKLMEMEPTAEQTGFLSVSDSSVPSLRMGGGEFCGNATMSAAVYYAMNAELTKGHVFVRVSGAPEPVSVEIEAGQDGNWTGTVEMPGPCSIETFSFPDGKRHPVVSFRGISHVILERDIPKTEAEALAKNWCTHLGADALGLMFLNREQGRLNPLVYVPAADTLFWENSCGSGTSAVGAWLAQEAGQPVKIGLQQPGGILEIFALPVGKLLLKGTVKCLYERVAAVEWP